MKRGYSLPQGCKDLIDALKLKAQISKPGDCKNWIDVSKFKQASQGPVKVKPLFGKLTQIWLAPRHP